MVATLDALRVTTFRLLWQVHKWTGIVLGLILLVSTTTGLLLLLKRDFDWIQPPTTVGTAGAAEQIATMQQIYATVFALDLPQLATESDIDRVDFRPGQRVFKVRSKHDYLEVQVDAITLKTSAPTPRNSDWLEELHDGSYFGAPMHGFVMPIASLGFVLLIATGYLLWIWPSLVKRCKRAFAASSKA